MKESNYIRAIWIYRRAVLLILVATVALTGIITFVIPPAYTSTATLQALSSDSLPISGYSSRDNDVDFDTYEALIGDPNFKQEVLALARALAKPSEISERKLTSFKISADQPSKTNILELRVEARHPTAAKILASAAAQVLLKRTSELGLENIKQMERTAADELQATDKKLSTLRRELSELKSKPVNPDTVTATAQRSIELAHLEDEINALEGSRRVYADLLAKLSLSTLLQKNALRLVYPATEPSYPSSPSWPKNLLTAAIVGLVLGMGTAVLLDYVQKAREAR